MSIHRYRAVIDFYADERLKLDGAREYLRTVTTQMFPLGVVDGYPDVWDTQDKIEAIRRERLAEEA